MQIFRTFVEVRLRPANATPHPMENLTESTEETLRRIKRNLHGMMNGPVSSSMRQKGLAYKVNFGVELPRLQAFACELPHTYELAAALWKEDIRECRLLAGMLMPPECFDGELADLWVSQMRYPEEAECTTLHLFSRMACASDKAFEWMASSQAKAQLCGFLLMARLLMQGAMPTRRDQQEFLDQAAAALQSDDTATARAAGKALVKFMELGPAQEREAEEVLARLQPPAAPYPEA